MAKFYVTTPIYYVNQSPHVGTAYTTIAADVLARFHRLLGDDTFFLTGTDEHGTKVEESAKQAQKSPRSFCDEIAEQFKIAWLNLNISNDNFIRTTDPHHERAVSWVLKTLYDEGYIYKGNYTALYCVGCEQYKTKSELVKGKCPDHNIKPEERMEECYLFKLSSFQDELLTLIETDKLKIEPLQRKNEMVSFLEKEKLKDLAISRPKEKVSWGIPLPFDPSHTTYVWVDAFLNYLTGLGWPEDKKNFKRYWPPDVQLMAKDILRVHATIWPSILLALKLELPKRIYVHGYFTVNGQKMSKSLGNVIDPNVLVGKYGPDVIRYFILAEFPFGTDGDFSIKRLEESYNFDLANDLGNLLHRTIPMIEKYCQGKIPEAKDTSGFHEKLKDVSLNSAREVVRLIDDLNLRGSLTKIWEIVRAANKYIDEAAPWALAKESQIDRLNTVMVTIAESLRVIAVIASPFIPDTATKIWSQLGIGEPLEGQSLRSQLIWGKIPVGTAVKREEVLFPRIPD